MILKEILTKMLTRKSPDEALAGAKDGGLEKTLGVWDLIILGVGAIIGSGIFAVVGTAAADPETGAGPALMVSMVIAAIDCIFSALCYSEFSTMIPVAGGAYTYTFATLGECMAWLIGWILMLEYAIGFIAVACAWTNHFMQFIKGFSSILPAWFVDPPAWLISDYRSAAHYYTAQGQDPHTVIPHVLGMPISINLPAIIMITLITAILVKGTKDSAKMAGIMVAVKLGVIALFVLSGAFFIKPENWTPFAPNGFVYMEKEPLFVTKRGVYAITAEDISGEKYTQNRSFYINKKICAEENLRNVFCTKWKQFYLMSFGDKLFLLDTSQKSYQRGEPLSSYQYECYLWNGFDSRILWEEEGELYFGDNEGRICKFVEGKYSDNGKAINAYWTIPDFFGNNFWQNKTIRVIALQTAALPMNEVRLEYRKAGIWNVLKEWRGKISFFSWKDFTWNDFSWSGDTTYRTITAKVKIKKFDKTAFKIICDGLERAFGLYGFALEYTENGRYKK